MDDIAFSLDELAAPALAYDADGRILAVNQAACDILGRARGDLLACTMADIDLRWANRQGDSGEVLFRRADGATVPMELLAHRAGGRVVATAHDLSARRHAEHELDSLLDNITDVYYRTDRDGRMLAISRSIRDLLGFTPDEVIGRDVREFYVDREQREQLVAATDDRGGRMQGYDIELKRKDGSTVWVSVSARRVVDVPNGGLEGFLRDVTDRRLAEMRQRENQEIVQALLNATTDATMMIARDGTLLACNTVFADRFGHTVAEVVGHDLFALFPPDVAQSRRAACEEAFATGQPTRLVDQRGGRHLDNTITPIPGPGGVIDRVAIFSRDVTEEFETRASIARHISEVERSNADLEQFAYVASHDLREPLRLVSNYVSLLERRYADKLDQDARDFIHYARDGARRMDRLILDLLEYSRVSRADVAHGPVPLINAIHEAEANLAYAVQAAEGSLSVDVAPDLIVSGSVGQLTRLLQNLIANGLKYRAEGRPPRIRIDARRDGAWAELRVADNGIGIEPAYFDRIFRIFQRLHPSHRYEGTGIGLAICRRIAERHGGTIGVESVPGEGSTFVIRLPAN